MPSNGAVQFVPAVPKAAQPLSVEEARARLRSLSGEPNASELSREWDWSRAKVRRLIAALRADGSIPPAATTKNNGKAKTRAATPAQVDDAPVTDNNPPLNTPAISADNERRQGGNG
jgi:hypothetical protein